MNTRNASNLRSDCDGATIVEFAMVLPVLMTLLLGIFELSYNMYGTAILEGAMQEAGRDSTVEDAATGAIDSAVTAQVRRAIPGATIVYSRSAYAEFGDVAKPEDFSDLNGDGICNDGEPFEDANGNGFYDEDRGISGQGGARNAVVITATMSFERFFPIDKFTGLSPEYRTSSSTVLRNQPYDANRAAPLTENCI